MRLPLFWTATQKLIHNVHRACQPTLHSHDARACSLDLSKTNICSFHTSVQPTTFTTLLSKRILHPETVDLTFPNEHLLFCRFLDELAASLATTAVKCVCPVKIESGAIHEAFRKSGLEPPSSHLWIASLTDLPRLFGPLASAKPEDQNPSLRVSYSSTVPILYHQLADTNVLGSASGGTLWEGKQSTDLTSTVTLTDTVREILDISLG